MTTPVRIDPEGASYANYSQHHDYTHDLGTVVLPAAGRTANHRVIRLHGGIATRTVRWTAGRRGMPPLIPAPADLAGDTLLSTTVVPSLPMPNNDRSGYDWVVSGTYTYVQNTPRIVGQNALPTGTYPYVLLNQARLADDSVGSHISSIANNSQIVNKLDAISEEAMARATPTEDGTISWPFTFLPPDLTSTHLIGG